MQDELSKYRFVSFRACFMSTSFSLIELRTVWRLNPLCDCQLLAAKTSLILNNISTLPQNVQMPEKNSTHIKSNFSQGVSSDSVLYGGSPLSLSVSHRQRKQVYFWTISLCFLRMCSCLKFFPHISQELFTRRSLRLHTVWRRATLCQSPAV